MNLVTSAIRGLKATVQGGYGGRYGSIGRGSWWSREGIDIRAEAGIRVDNSIVYTAISRATLAFLEADLIVKRPVNGKLQVIENHPVTKLLRQPVTWYSGQDWRACLTMAEILTGNAYSLKHRSDDGKLIGLEYLPISMCKPISVPGSGNFVDFYECVLGVGIRQVAPGDIYHQKWHTVNAWTNAISIGPLESVLPEIAADNRCARYEAAVLRNGGKAHMLTPRGQDKDGRPLTFGKEQREQLAQVMREEASGDAAGSMAAVNFPMDVLEIGWKPSDLMLGPVRDLSEERIAAAVGAPASWLGYGSGLDSDSNKATREAVNELALDIFVLPHLQRIEQQLTDDLIGVELLGEPGDVVQFDRSQIAALRKRTLRLLVDGATATGGPVATVNEYREWACGWEPVKGGETIRGLGVTQQEKPQSFEDEENPDE